MASRQDTVRSQAFEAGRKEKAAAMTCGKKGAKHISRALNPPSASPLLYARRDKLGFKGEAVGTIATDPREVDDIATRQWSNIYNGNFENLEQQAEIFMEKYDPFIKKQEAYPGQKITGEQVEAAAKKARASAAGLDNWEPAELAMLNSQAYQWIADMLNLIEAGRPWPEGTEQVRAAYLAKDPGRSAEPLCHRVLMLLQAINRLWGSLRLDCLQGWAD